MFSIFNLKIGVQYLAQSPSAKWGQVEVFHIYSRFELEQGEPSISPKMSTESISTRVCITMWCIIILVFVVNLPDSTESSSGCTFVTEAPKLAENWRLLIKSMRGCLENIGDCILCTTTLQRDRKLWLAVVWLILKLTGFGFAEMPHFLFVSYTVLWAVQ